MSNKLTIKEHLSLDDFDPLSIDITKIKEVSDSMPLDANIDAPNAENLALKFLRAADECAEILSTLILLESKAKSNVNTIKNRLYLEASDHGHKTIKDRQAYAESHDTYVAAVEKHDEIYATRKFFDTKQQWFVDAHRLMKQRLRGEYNHGMSSGFSETSGPKHGEKSW